MLIRWSRRWLKKRGDIVASKDKKQITLEFNVTTSEFKKNIADLSDKISVLNNKLKLNAVELKIDHYY